MMQIRKTTEQLRKLDWRTVAEGVIIGLIGALVALLLVLSVAGLMGTMPSEQASPIGDAQAANSGGWTYGFESGDFSTWSTVTTGWEISDSAYNGEYAALNNVPTDSKNELECNNCGELSNSNISSMTFRIKMVETPSGSYDPSWNFQDTSAGAGGYFFYRSDDTVETGDGTHVLNMSTGRWYVFRVDNFTYNQATNTRTVEVWDGETGDKISSTQIQKAPAKEIEKISIAAQSSRLKVDYITVNKEFSGPPTPTPEPTEVASTDYKMSICYGGDAEFQSTGAEATWNPYPTVADNSWASSEYSGDQSNTVFNRYGDTVLEDARTSPNVSYRVGVESGRASFVFDGINPTENNTRGQFEIASPFEDWVQDSASISSRSVCDPDATTTGTTTPEPTPIPGTPPEDAKPAAIGTCTLPAADGEKTGLLVEYWDPTMNTESLSFNLSYNGYTTSESVEFDEPKGYHFGCYGANGGIEPPEGGTPTPFPELTAYPNGTTPTPYPEPTAYPQPEPPELNGSANFTDGSSSNFSSVGFDDFDSANSLNGDLSGRFGPTAGGGSGGSPIVGVGLVAAVGYGALRLTGNDKRVAQAVRNTVGRLR